MPTRRRPRLAAALAIAVVATPALGLLARAQPGITPQDAPANIALADEAFNRGQYQRAVDLYRAAQQDGVDHAMLHFRLGYALHVTGRTEEALHHHLRGASITLPAIRIDSLYNAACAHALLGHRDDALRYLQYAIDAGFIDTAQIAKDSDLDALRDDPRFIDLVAGIGTVPTLFHQLDFLLGEWEITLNNGRSIRYHLEQPSPQSAAITYRSVQHAGTAWVGMFVPDPVDRTWEWTYCDDIGTTYRLVGTVADGVATFEGRQHDAGGLGPHVRITFSTGSDGVVRERGEVSQDGETWRQHHDDVMNAIAPSPP